MKFFLLTARSSNEKSLNNFFKLLEENFKNKKTNIVKIGRFIANKKIVTVLKSPHVNKSAQEQFEKREKIVQIILISENLNKTIIIIKKVLNIIFSDLTLTIKYLTDNLYNKVNKLEILKNTNFILDCSNKISINKLFPTKKTIKYLYYKNSFVKFKTYFNILNNYGETLFKKISKSE